MRPSSIMGRLIPPRKEQNTRPTEPQSDANDGVEEVDNTDPASGGMSFGRSVECKKVSRPATDQEPPKHKEEEIVNTLGGPCVAHKRRVYDYTPRQSIKTDLEQELKSPAESKSATGPDEDLEERLERMRSMMPPEPPPRPRERARSHSLENPSPGRSR